jgi:predicted transcriptional regulator
MEGPTLDSLPPRERQIVALLYSEGESTVAEIRGALPVELSSQAVRAMLTRLEGKGFVKRRRSTRGYVFSPAVAESKAKQSALRQLVQVFFNGSSVGAVSALLGMSEDLDEEELEELERMIAKARKERRG